MASASPIGGTDKFAPQEDDGLQVVPFDEAQKIAAFHTDETAPKYPASQRGPAYNGADAPEAYVDNTTPMLAQEDHDNHDNEKAAPPAPEKRYLGLRKTPFVIICVVAILAIIGAVLGGVLGSVLPNKTTKKAPGSVSHSIILSPTKISQVKSRQQWWQWWQWW